MSTTTDLLAAAAMPRSSDCLKKANAILTVLSEDQEGDSPAMNIDEVNMTINLANAWTALAAVTLRRELAR